MATLPEQKRIDGGNDDGGTRHGSMVTAYNKMKENGNEYAKWSSLEGYDHSNTLSAFSDEGVQDEYGNVINGRILFDWMLSQTRGNPTAGSSTTAVNETILTYLPYDDKDRIVRRTTTQLYGTKTTFDGQTVFNLFRDYPYKLSPEQKQIFDSENPYWADFFKDRT